MEHTVEAYLGRQSTDILKVVLQGYCVSEESAGSNADVVILVLKELERRGELLLASLPSYIQIIWDAYRQEKETALR